MCQKLNLSKFFGAWKNLKISHFKICSKILSRMRGFFFFKENFVNYGMHPQKWCIISGIKYLFIIYVEKKNKQKRNLFQSESDHHITVEFLSGQLHIYTFHFPNVNVYYDSVFYSSIQLILFNQTLSFLYIHSLPLDFSFIHW